MRSAIVATDEHSPRQVLTQGLSGGRSVFARHDGADEEGDDPQRDEAVTALPGQWVSRLRRAGNKAEKLSTTVAKMSTP